MTQRFGYYFIGIAFGLILLGFFVTNRQKAVEAQKAAEQQLQQQGAEPPGASGEGPASGDGSGNQDAPDGPGGP